jgi:hypothetical protein
MSRPITISIPKPCHENWQEMTATQRGAFCKSCQKEVIDFTKKTEDETHRILSSGGATCGRFRTDQLERPIHQTTYIRSWWHWKAIAASAIAFIGYKESKSSVLSDHRTNALFVDDTTAHPSSNSAAISGRIVDERNIGIEGMALHIKDSKNTILKTILTGPKGYFSINRKDTNLDVDTIYIETKSLRFINEKIQLSGNTDTSISIRLKLPVIVTLSASGSEAFIYGDYIVQSPSIPDKKLLSYPPLFSEPKSNPIDLFIQYIKNLLH